MSTFQEYHGISLANNSWIENLFVEQLSSDPVPVGPGRVWFNTTDKVFRQSSLDGTGAVVIRTFATSEQLAASVSALEGSIAGLDTRLTSVEGTYIKKDGSVAFTASVNAGGFAVTNVGAPVATTDAATKGYVDSADAALDAKIAALGNAFNYVGTLEGGATAGSAYDLATLAASGKNAGDYYKVAVAGYFKLGSETFLANLGDGLVFNIAGGVDKIDNTDSQVFGTTDYIAVTGSADTGYTVDVDSVFKGRVSTVETGLATEITNRTTADTALGGRIDTEVAARVALAADLATEVTRATGVEGSLATLTTTAKTSLVAAINELDADLANEGSIRASADVALGGRIDTEITDRTAADTALGGRIDTEITNRTTADTALQGQIGTLSSLTTTVKTDLVSAVNAVVALVGNGVGDLITQLNNYRYTATSASPAMSHTFNHAMGSTLVDVCVWIDRGDGVWRNDMAAVSILDGNNVKVDLTVARLVRVTIEKMEDFA